MTALAGPACACGRTDGIRGYGDPDLGVMLVGIAPGRHEAKVSGRPFTGSAGRLMDGILRAVHWPREATYCTNLLCWFKDEPDYDDIRACQPRLVDEICTYKPKLIVTLGAIPSSVLYGERKARGVPIWKSYGSHSCYVMSTYHPASCLYEGGAGNADDIYRDLAKIPSILGYRPNDIGVYDYTIVTCKEHAQYVLNELPRSAATPVALDIETDSLSVDTTDMFEDALLCLAVASSENHAYVLPRDVLDGLNWPVDVRWLTHSGTFDMQAIRKGLGIRLPIAEDTLLMSYSLDERSSRHSLAAVGGEYGRMGFWKDATKAYRKTHMRECPTDILYKYNAGDAIATLRGYNVMRLMQEEDGVRSMYVQLLIPGYNAFTDMNYRGIKVDSERVKELALQWLPLWLAEEERLNNWALELGNGAFAKFNVGSHAQVNKLLYDVLELPLTERGRTTKSEALEDLKHLHPFVGDLINYRHLDHVVSSYVMGLQDDIKGDGRVHPDVWLHGTRTGRRSYHRPPLQQMPNTFMLGADLGRCRSMFAASDDEHILVEADYKQLELWMAAYLSHDDNMLEFLKSGDYHSEIVSKILGKRKEDSDPDEWEMFRFVIKRVVYGIMYGRSARSLAIADRTGAGAFGRALLKGTEFNNPKAAEAFIQDFFAQVPNYHAWWKEQKRKAIRDGELITPAGRKRRFRFQPDLRTLAHAQRQAVNNSIQSTGGDYTLSSMIELHGCLAPYDSYVLLDNHDSLLFDVSKQNFQRCTSLIKEVMERPRYGLGFVPIDMKAGPRWGELQKLNPTDTYIKDDEASLVEVD